MGSIQMVKSTDLFHGLEEDQAFLEGKMRWGTDSELDLVSGG